MKKTTLIKSTCYFTPKYWLEAFNNDEDFSYYRTSFDRQELIDSLAKDLTKACITVNSLDNCTLTMATNRISFIANKKNMRFDDYYKEYAFKSYCSLKDLKVEIKKSKYYNVTKKDMEQKSLVRLKEDRKYLLDDLYKLCFKIEKATKKIESLKHNKEKI